MLEIKKVIIAFSRIEGKKVACQMLMRIAPRITGLMHSLAQ